MKKNIVFIPYIKREDVNVGNGQGKARWDSGYDYGIASWKNWCEKHDCELFIMDQPMVPESEMLITWQRWNVLNILEHNEIEYDQVLVVDADSLVHPDCPNFFKLTDHKFSSQLNDGCYEWVNRAIHGYSKAFFNKDFCIRASEFFQAGFVIVNERHKKFLDDVVQFYWDNKQSIIESYKRLVVGTDIALLNCLRKEMGMELNILPKDYSVMDISRKNLLYYQPCWWADDLTNLYNSGWIYQYTSIPESPMGRDRKYWMKRMYEELYER